MRITVRAIVVQELKGDLFKLKLDEHPDHIVFAKLAGKLRISHITVKAGDLVSVELSPYDLTRGRVTWRH